MRNNSNCLTSSWVTLLWRDCLWDEIDLVECHFWGERDTSSVGLPIERKTACVL